MIVTILALQLDSPLQLQRQTSLLSVEAILAERVMCLFEHTGITEVRQVDGLLQPEKPFHIRHIELSSISTVVHGSNVSPIILMVRLGLNASPTTSTVVHGLNVHTDRRKEEIYGN